VLKGWPLADQPGSTFREAFLIQFAVQAEAENFEAGWVSEDRPTLVVPGWCQWHLSVLDEKMSSWNPNQIGSNMLKLYMSKCPLKGLPQIMCPSMLTNHWWEGMFYLQPLHKLNVNNDLEHQESYSLSSRGSWSYSDVSWYFGVRGSTWVVSRMVPVSKWLPTGW